MYSVIYATKKRWTNTANKEWIFRLAKKIKEKWKAAEEEEERLLWSGMGGAVTIDYGDEGLLNHTNLKLMDYRAHREYHDSKSLNEWEKNEVVK